MTPLLSRFEPVLSVFESNERYTAEIHCLKGRNQRERLTEYVTTKLQAEPCYYTLNQVCWVSTVDLAHGCLELTLIETSQPNKNHKTSVTTLNAYFFLRSIVHLDNDFIFWKTMPSISYMSYTSMLAILIYRNQLMAWYSGSNGYV